MIPQIDIFIDATTGSETQLTKTGSFVIQGRNLFYDDSNESDGIFVALDNGQILKCQILHQLINDGIYTYIAFNDIPSTCQGEAYILFKYNQYNIRFPLNNWLTLIDCPIKDYSPLFRVPSYIKTLEIDKKAAQLIDIEKLRERHIGISIFID